MSPGGAVTRRGCHQEGLSRELVSGVSREKVESQTRGLSERASGSSGLCALSDDRARGVGLLLVGTRLTDAWGGGAGLWLPVSPAGEGCADPWSLVRTLQERNCSLQPGPPLDLLPKL